MTSPGTNDSPGRPQTFAKEERLCRRGAFQALRERGRKYYARGVSFVWLAAPRAPEDRYPARAAFIVPKRSLRRAPDRNRARRLLRESYRKQKRVLYDAAPPGGCVYLLIIYHRKNLSPYDEVFALVGKGLAETAAALAAPGSEATENGGPTDSVQ